MKLESLKLGKFKDNTLKREQMFVLNGGGIPSTGGNICADVADIYGNVKKMNFNYGFDSNRNGIITFHNRTDYKDICDNGYATAE